MTPPKFSVGERVRVRSISHPEFNCDFALIIKKQWRQKGAVQKHGGVFYEAIFTGWHYSLIGFAPDFYETALHPIPDDDEGLAEFISQITRQQAEPA